MTAKVKGHRIQGRHKKRCGDMIRQDMKSLRIKKEHIGDWKKWRERIWVADPSSERD